MTCLDDLAWNYSVKDLFLLVTVTKVTVKYLLPIFIAAVVRETYSFIKIMQSISPNYNWENGVKQIRLLKTICHKSCILCQLLRRKTLASGYKCIKYFLFLPLFALYMLSGCDLFNMSYLTYISLIASLEILSFNLLT